jgi:hypothetical protein
VIADTVYSAAVETVQLARRVRIRRIGAYAFHDIWRWQLTFGLSLSMAAVTRMRHERRVAIPALGVRP